VATEPSKAAAETKTFAFWNVGWEARTVGSEMTDRHSLQYFRQPALPEATAANITERYKIILGMG